jgi:hypothetical protein
MMVLTHLMIDHRFTSQISTVGTKKPLIDMKTFPAFVQALYARHLLLLILVELGTPKSQRSFLITHGQCLKIPIKDIWRVEVTFAE